MKITVTNNKVSALAENLEEAKVLLSLALTEKPKRAYKKQENKPQRKFYCGICLAEGGSSDEFNLKGLNPHLRFKHNVGGLGSAKKYAVEVK